MNIDAQFAKNAKINFVFANYGYEIKKKNRKIKINNFKDIKKIIK